MELTLLQLLPHFRPPCVRDGRVLLIRGTSSLQGPEEALPLPFRKPYCREDCLRFENIVHVQIVFLSSTLRLSSYL